MNPRLFAPAYNLRHVSISAIFSKNIIQTIMCTVPGESLGPYFTRRGKLYVLPILIDMGC
jgi:hypothetical protein